MSDFYYNHPYEHDWELDEKLMVFMSWPDFTNNALMFWKYINENTDYKTVWMVADDTIRERMIEEGITCCRHDYTDAKPYLSRAKYVVFEKGIVHHFPKPKGQIVVHIYSVTSSFYDDNFSSRLINIENHLNGIALRSVVTDLFVTCSDFSRVESSVFHFHDARRIYALGSPAYDSIFIEDGRDVLFGAIPMLRNYKRLILYCPGVNKMHNYEIGRGLNKDIFKFENLDQQELSRFLEKHHAAIVMKLHPIDENNDCMSFSLPEHCYLINSHSFWGKTLYHVFNAFDILITDLSKTALEFLLLDRPILYNRAGYEKIREKVSCIIENDDFISPGQKFRNSAELFDAIETAIEHPEYYHEERMRILPFAHKYFDGKSSERILKFLEDYTPPEHPYYNLFALPLEEKIEKLNCEIEEKTEELKHELAKAQQALAYSQENLNSIFMSKSYRLLQKITGLLFPLNSRRRRFVIWCYSLLWSLKKQLKKLFI